MFKQMMEHYAPLSTSIKTMFGYKSSSFFGTALVTSFSLEAVIKYILHGQFIGVSVLLLLLVSGFILTDWWYGSKASKKLYNEALLTGIKEDIEKYKFRSIKISHTWFKFLSLWLWLMVALGVRNYASSIELLATIVEGFTIVPILLFGFREFVSIGESIETLNGTKPYLFELGEKIFNAIQLKFLNKFKE